ncbi:MAG: ABC transporter ATP-binding protein [Hyphomicrobiales bacterium]
MQPAFSRDAAHRRASAALDVENLGVRIDDEGTGFAVVEEMTFAVGAGETLCIVGESGCGKSMTALSLLGLLPDAAHVVSGTVRIDGEDLLALPRRLLEDRRGARIAMIFQEPLTSLNPVMTIGRQIAEGIRRHRRIGASEAFSRAVGALRHARMPDPERRARQYAHELSGGMRQRAMIALALACEPRVLIADEPTTALDVTVQAQILGLIGDLQRRLGTALVLITHDLGVVAEIADRVIVMYAGRKVEEAAAAHLFDWPLHPYTRMLMRAAPRLGASPQERLAEIPGTVPALWALPDGCAFAPRCPHAVARCARERPPLALKEPGHTAACWQVPDA